MRTVLATLALLALVLAACAPASTEPSEEASVAESQAAESQAAESQAAESEGGFPFPSFTSGAVAELEAFIPEEIGGIAMQIFSMRGDEFLSSGQDDPATAEFLQRLGVSPDDVSMAFGFGLSEDYESSAAMFVFRAEGASTQTLIDVFRESTNEDREVPLDWQSTTVGGKTVLTAVDPESNNQTDYLYAVGDVLFVVSATDPTAAEDVIAGLP